MKTFRDLKIGDYIYAVYDFGLKCSKFKIVDIIDHTMYLQENEWGNIFADTTKILEYVNESV